MNQHRMILALATTLAAAALLPACAPTIYYNQHGMQVTGGGGRDSATEYHGKPTPIQVAVVEAALRNDGLWPIKRYFQTALNMRKNPPEVSFIKKYMVQSALQGLDYLIKVFKAAGVPEEQVTAEMLHKLYAKIIAPHIAKALLEQGWATFAFAPGAPNKEMTSLDIGPGGGGYFTPYPDRQEIGVHIATEISANAWKHFLFDTSKVDKCFSHPVTAVKRQDAEKLLVLQVPGDKQTDSSGQKSSDADDKDDDDKDDDGKGDDK